MKPSAAPALALVSLVFLSAQSSGDGAKGWKGSPKPAASPKAAVAMDGSLDGRVMLGRPEAGSIALSAYFDLPSEYYYGYGADPAAMDAKTGIKKAAGKGAVTDLIEGLAPGRVYAYRLHWKRNGDAAFREGEAGRFVTARPSGQEFSFIVEADPHLDEASDGPGYADALARMKSLAPDFVIDLGDASMAEKLAKDEAGARERNLLLRSYWDDAGGTAPFFMVLGNHDGETGWSPKPGQIAVPEEKALRRSLFPNPFPAAGSLYSGLSDTAFSFEWGDALFIVLDPYSYVQRKPKDANWDWTLGREQYDWLAKTLSASKAAFRFVFIHNLVGARGNDNRGGAMAAGYYEWGGKTEDGGAYGFAAHRPGWPLPVHELLARGGVDVVFHGHDHFYAREEKDGIIYQLVPQPSLRMRQKAGELAAEYGYGGDLAPSPGFIRVTVGPSGARVELLGAGSAAAPRSYALKP